MEDSIRTFLQSDSFQSTYPNVYSKWLKAEESLYTADWEKHLTNIGHDCREAIQEFADVLIHRHDLQDSYPDKNKDIRRIQAVINQEKDQLGQREKDFLDALCQYWKSVSGLIQRQEHGIQDVKTSLSWEDGRRVVFQSAIIMFEVDSSLHRINQ